MQKEKNIKNSLRDTNFSNSKVYLQTSDLGLATALCCKDYELVSLDKSDSRKVSFIFKKDTGIGETIEAYWANQLEAKARAYFDNLRTLKNRIYSA